MLNLARAAISELIRIAVPIAVATLVLVPAFLGLSIWWGGQNDVHRLGLLPKELHVSRTIDYAYAGDQVPLPSANSNGLIIYELPASTAKRIATGGNAELNKLLVGERQNQERFRIWHETPLAFTDVLSLEYSLGSPSDGTFGNFMRGRWQSTASPELEQEAADLLQHPGSFYSYDREHLRLLIVSPSAFRVVFAFSD